MLKTTTEEKDCLRKKKGLKDDYTERKQ